MQRSARNLSAGFLASGVSTLAGLVVVPVYLRLLGAEGYGLVALFLTLQGLLQVFDVGLTATASREVARSRGGSGAAEVGDLVRALAFLTWTIAAALTLLLLLAAPLLSTRWLRFVDTSQGEATASLLLMALALGLRWPAGLYQNVLLGADRQDRWGAISMATTVLAHAGAALLLWVWGGGTAAFFCWQIAAALVQVGWARAAARRELPTRGTGRPDLRLLRGVREFSVTMLAIGTTGLVLTHLDKLVLSRMLSLADFGHYMLASVVAGGIYTLVMPVFSWAYPRLTLMAAGAVTELQASYRFLSHAMAAFLCPVALLLAVGGEGLLTLWLGDAQVARTLTPVLALLAFGSALHGIMFMPYALTLARGASRLALYINIVQLAVLGPLLVIFTLRFGPIGAAAAWLLLHACYLLVGGWITHRALLPSVAGRWLLADVGPPLLLSLLLAGAARALLVGSMHDAPAASVLALGVLSCVLGWAVMLAGSRRLRQALRAPFVESTA